MKKKIILTEEQFKGAIKEAILLNNKRKVLREAVNEIISEEIKIRKKIDFYLNEGPLSNIWQGLKAAGSDFGQSLSAMGNNMAQAGRSAMAQGRMAAQRKALMDQVGSMSKEVAKAKQKFNQGALKNVQDLGQYHDAVVNLFQSVQQMNRVLGKKDPEFHKALRQSADAISGLANDLNSEKEQIDSFLKVLKKQTMMPIDSMADRARAKQTQARDAEADESGRSLTGRARVATGRVPRK